MSTRVEFENDVFCVMLGGLAGQGFTSQFIMAKAWKIAKEAGYRRYSIESGNWLPQEMFTDRELQEILK